jgi:hypothetical protein
LAVKEHVAASKQNQALSAVPFHYEHVLEQPLDRIDGNTASEAISAASMSGAKSLQSAPPVIA